MTFSDCLSCPQNTDIVYLRSICHSDDFERLQTAKKSLTHLVKTLEMQRHTLDKFFLLPVHTLIPVIRLFIILVVLSD